MIAAGIMGGIGVALMFLTQQQTQQTIRSKSDADLAMAKSEIIGILNNPSHCNANFKSLSTGTAAVTEIYTCSSGACTGTGGSRTVRFRAQPTGWPGTSANLQGQISERTKISSISRKVVSLPTSGETVNSGVLEIKFTFRPLTGPETNQIINFPVSLVTNSSLISGCPKSTNSTQAY